ncbi:hypothetical protein Daesc_001323 [Daldinia eschscholtzii]|uniref:FAD-binding PCMH-type domain-containing protein n=1 Tax=Daldinia eschscholtzii TaxID=292717 RepID=A0AAX6MUE8_9PEZI
MERPTLSRDIQWPRGTAIHYPGSQEFEAATLRWSVYKAPTFAAAVTPSDEEEVAKIVKVARAANVPFLATGGRHGYGTSLGKLQGGLAIDLSKMKSIDIDKGAGTVTVGAGVQIGEAIRPVYEAGYELPVGSCPHVGLIGATLGGGIGILQGLFGLVIDSLLSARLVTADGNLIEVSASSNPDLFWAIRGAGANFGIITSATYKLNKAVNNAELLLADAIYPASMKSAYFDTLEAFESKMPQELSIISTILWDANSNQTQIVGTFIYSGPEDQGRQVLAPFLELNPPIARLISSTMNTTFDKFHAFCKENIDGRSSVCVFETFSNDAVASVAADTTAYPWRDAKGNIMFQMTWPDSGNPVGEAADSLGRELRQDFFRMSGYDDLSVYVSYAHGDETLEQIYGKDKLPRLVSLKKKWDPENVFGYSNSLLRE